MAKQYSIAEARRNFAKILRKAEAGVEVELTRHGEAIAVLVSIDEYHRAIGKLPSFRENYQSFVERYSPKELGFSTEYFDSLRDREPGRDVEL